MKAMISLRRVTLAALSAACAASIIASCGGGGGSAMSGPMATPGPKIPVIHINFFGSSNGVFSDAKFGDVSGFTQQTHAEVLGMSPGAQVVITNNDSVAHTLNVFSAYPSPGPQSTAAAPNGSILAPGYQTGVLQPGQSTGVLTVSSTPGDLFILCGIHYGMGMKDGLVIQVGATPGPQATSSGGSCTGYGC